ncbi:MAG: glutamine amidotransferase [Chloroflexota bacterium]
MAGKRVLLAGETWMSYGIHMKGFAAYTTGKYSEGMQAFVAALEGSGHEVVHIPNHLATTEFPDSIEKLRGFDVVILSDLPADTLLLHPDTFELGLRTPDRLALLVDWIDEGGGFLMVGGYMSFSGFEGKARYQNTALADALPVSMLGFDDRIELPAGANPRVMAPHPVVDGLDEEWPFVLGYNRFIAKPDATVVAECGGDPFLVLGSHGAGRVAAYASDQSPHWASPEFMAWSGYAPLWSQMIEWLGEGKS